MGVFDLYTKEIIREQLFIGLLKFNDDELEDLKSQSRELILSHRGLNLEEQTTVIITIVNILKRWDGNKSVFWEYITRQLDIEYKYVTTSIYKIILAYFNNQNRIIYTSEHNKNSYYSTLLAQSLGPKKSMFDLISLLNIIYEDSLLFDYRKNDKAFKIIVNNLKNKINGDKSENDVVIDLGSIGIYNLKSSTRYLIVDDTERFLILMDQIMSFFSDSNNLLGNTYLQSLLKEWKSIQLVDENKEKIKYTKKITDLENWKPKYKLNNRSLTLIVPFLRLNDFSDLNNYEIKIKCHGSTKSERLRIGGNNLFKYIKEQEFFIDYTNLDMDNRLSIDLFIYADNKIIYRSESIKNNSIMFFKNGHEILDAQLKPGSYIGLTTFESIIESNRSAFRMSKYLYEIDIENDFSIEIDNDYFYSFQNNEEISEKLIAIVHGKQYKNSKFVLENSDYEYEIYQELENIEIKIFDNEIKTFKVRFSGTKNGNIFHKDFIVNDDRDSFYLDVLEIVREFDDLVRVSILNSETYMRYQVFAFVLLESLPKITNVFYFDRCIKEVENQEYYFNDENKALIIPFCNGAIRTYVKYLEFKLNNEVTHNRSIEKILWHEDFDINSFFVIKTDVEEVLKVTFGNEMLEIKTNTRFYFYNLLEQIERKNTFDTKIKIKVLKNNEWNKIFEIGMKTSFCDKPIIESYGSDIYYDFSENYIGPNNPQLELILENDEYQNKYPVELSGEFNDETFLGGDYKVKIVRKNSNPFLVQNDQVLYSGIMKIGDDYIFEFHERILNLKKCNLKAEHKLHYKLPNYELRNIIFLEFNGFPQYTADLVLANKTEKVIITVYNKAQLSLDKWIDKAEIRRKYNFDTNKNLLTLSKANNINIYEIDDIYFN